MERSIRPSATIYNRFQNLSPLRSPDRETTEKLASSGYWAAYENGRFFLVVGYRPAASVAEILDETLSGSLPAPAPWRLVEVEEYKEREEWRRRVLPLITPPNGSDAAEIGARLRPTPPAPAFPYAESLPEGA